MTTTGEFAAERAQLGTRDRDELHEIASAMGVRGATRLRKADLIEAILDKATGGTSVPEPTGDKPKKRATRKKTADPAEAAEAPEPTGPAPAPAPAPAPGGAKGRAEAPARAEGPGAAPPAAEAGRPAAAVPEPAPSSGDGDGAEPGAAEPQRFTFEASASTGAP